LEGALTNFPNICATFARIFLTAVTALTGSNSANPTSTSWMTLLTSSPMETGRLLVAYLLADFVGCDGRVFS
jgi:hypothetical protein